MCKAYWRIFDTMILDGGILRKMIARCCHSLYSKRAWLLPYKFRHLAWLLVQVDRFLTWVYLEWHIQRIVILNIFQHSVEKSFWNFTYFVTKSHWFGNTSHICFHVIISFTMFPCNIILAWHWWAPTSSPIYYLKRPPYLGLEHLNAISCLWILQDTFCWNSALYSGDKSWSTLSRRTHVTLCVWDGYRHHCLCYPSIARKRNSPNSSQKQ